MEELSRKARRREERRLKDMQKTAGSETAQHQESQKPYHKEPAWETKLKQYYDAHYMRLLWIPIIISMLSLAQIGYQYYSTGSFIEKSVSLKGGAVFSIQRPVLDEREILDFLKQQFPDNDIDVRTLATRGKETGIIVEADITEEQVDPMKMALESKLGPMPKGTYTVEFIGSSLGQSFFKQTMIALVIAFAFMSIVVFISFRVGAPAFFVILASVTDMLNTIAVFNILGIKLTAAGIAAFLMLIGYSIDTDVLLTTRVTRRREGTVTDATFDAMWTGLTMAAASTIAVFIGMIMTNSEVLRQIFLIILIGLIADVINTWLENAAILKWWIEVRGKHKEGAHHE